MNEKSPDKILRMIEAMIFASTSPVSLIALQTRLPKDTDIESAIDELQQHYLTRGVNLVKMDSTYAFRTAPDLGFLLRDETLQTRKFSRAAREVLAIIAYHQPITRAELEEIRGVETSKGTLDVLMEAGFIKLRGRRRSPGRPVTYGTTTAFLDHFSLADISDLPGKEELKGAGLLSSRLPDHFNIPNPKLDPDSLTEEEEPLADIDLEELGLFAPRD